MSETTTTPGGTTDETPQSGTDLLVREGDIAAD
jgi:hypothetical protein